MGANDFGTAQSVDPHANISHVKMADGSTRFPGVDAHTDLNGHPIEPKQVVKGTDNNGNVIAVRNAKAAVEDATPGTPSPIVAREPAKPPSLQTKTGPNEALASPPGASYDARSPEIESLPGGYGYRRIDGTPYYAVEKDLFDALPEQMTQNARGTTYPPIYYRDIINGLTDKANSLDVAAEVDKNRKARHAGYSSAADAEKYGEVFDSESTEYAAKVRKFIDRVLDYQNSGVPATVFIRDGLAPHIEKRTITHEGLHVGQIDVGKGAAKDALGNNPEHTDTFRNHPLYQTAKDALMSETFGYKEHQVDQEIPAFLAAGQHEEIGIRNRADALDFLSAYLQGVAAKHGIPETRRAFAHIDGLGREVLDQVAPPNGPPN